MQYQKKFGFIICLKTGGISLEDTTKTGAYTTSQIIHESQQPFNFQLFPVRLVPSQGESRKLSSAIIIIVGNPTRVRNNKLAPLIPACSLLRWADTWTRSLTWEKFFRWLWAEWLLAIKKHTRISSIRKLLITTVLFMLHQQAILNLHHLF